MFTASPFDWSTYRHMFSSEAMEAIFDERRTIACWIDVEKAVARAQAEVGIIPPDAADAIQRCGGADRIDLDRLHESTLEVGRPIVGLVAQLAEQVGPGHDVWVHYGVTTYDVMDTGRVLQIRDALGGILEGVRELRQRLADLAEKHRDTVMIGRTNGLHAQPITFGGKLACWIEELSRHDDRLDAASKRALVVQFGGAVGTLASLHPDGMRFRETVAAELGLGVPASNWHNARDSVTEVALCLGNLCATLARIAQNIKSLGSTEIGEVREGGTQGRGRSTSMAHKRNPRAGEFMEAVARLGRHRAMGMVEIMGQEHDRCGGTWIGEWMLLPESFLLTSGALGWALDLFDRLEIDGTRMRANVDMTNGLALTERYTLVLAKRMNKFRARQLVDEACHRAVADGLPLADALSRMPAIREVMTDDEVATLSVPETYVGAASEIVDRVLADVARRSTEGR